ncbi:CoA-acylating methylmalonate-semialdehyde dehydrogenase [Rhodobacter capsulatus]|jgi:malonate-semialdehyde dehydrogenase (acetylating)/methylmalonate-semialdehyde dehydrogenase|uniref:methylmalonate-semialdehyde dehydrogenase (CoA acylating) n=1 Tax=Rhodobacter capsulatus (strain ATCC BAA-309 / NBRC 16581 / SB1003) TaxID=272942 RepID=D5ATM1_RHOCB|nr:CoA-acylating methylmalonate-semialdehyde dehydrogenase [Rhodobacter capsulatus]ADE85310.1 methylmalonate-semialdehyde dehydrogenase (acylating) [Rhodobacter capsulatus SB 1003]ETD02029.1 methylmalonate-semialdehyde dehydrogenase [Rhodobacter capsulatus DE442]ETD77070.1 methylmalonate-semialdehyde dehydrogenase [Rhodobacter capsulatus R121]ETE54027.1 methylmalonate-semialdehyde dehydrogenase [Rhodobacter capsulatus Y262]MDS0927020.1 CoA-acylating methylmalonate-semialdehyde dehydrogenase [R
MKEIGHWIDGKMVAGTSGRFAEVMNPATGEVRAKVALATKAELDAAVAAAERAQPGWAATNPQRRARVMMKFADLINTHMDELAELVSVEHGKVLADGRGDVQRGLEVIEVCMGAPAMLKGEYTDGAGPGIDIYAMRQPLGVVAGITPFNFPAMIPLWKMGPALSAGNAMVLKPSERCPSTALRLAELAKEAGLPDGVLQVVNGDKDAVDAILDNETIQAVGFVGSTPIAQYIYGRACANGKRAQCFGGAKNHMLIMPDADMDKAADALVGAGYGAAGERCMAISVAVPVGKGTAEALISRLIPKIEKLKVGPYTGGADVDFGPVITAQARDRIEGLIASGVEQGAQLLIDGRGLTIQGYENGFYTGPSLFDHVTPEMEIYKQEIFGPVLSVVRAESYEEALKLVMDNDYGNGTAIFTADGDTARDFASRVNVGMVGINFPIPVPLSYYSFGGWKKSAFGDLNQYGPDAFRFYTKTKTVTARWFSGIKDGVALNFKALD